MNPIKFYRGEESSIIHEKYENRSNSIFAKQYELALSGIERFLELRKRKDSTHKTNNIFAFIGDRGMGKTSCMESVADMIPAFREGKERFKLIDTVDPSFFDENRNILEMVIGKMFSDFSKEASNASSTRGNDYESKKARLLASFKDVRHTISKMESDEGLNERGSISKLQDLAAAGVLSDKFHTLLSDYLAYFDSEVLILPIDDIDLNTSQADIMVEQLRKYLIQDNIIILMAVKLSQLSLVMEQKFTCQYKTLLDKHLIEQSALMDMVIKYLTKLIPLDHRIYMPAIETFFDTELQLYEEKKDESVPVLSGSSVKYTVTSLIFKKCRYLFYHSKGVTSLVVPTNLRDLRHLIELLYRMKDYRESLEEHNKEVFRNYLFETWMPDNLEWKGCESINELNAIKDSSVFNSMVLSHLEKRFGAVFSSAQRSLPKISTPSEQDELDMILHKKNSTYNISVGDIFVVLSLIKKSLYSYDDKVYVFLIETLYSFRLYHYYDEMTEKNQNKVANSVDETIRKIEIVDGLYNYEILTAGSLINTIYYNKLAAEETTKISRSIRPILLKPLRNCINELCAIEGEWTEEQNKLLQMVEFFVLHISHPYYNDRGRENSYYRCEKDLYYTTSFGSGKKLAIFNLNSIFTNFCNIERTYNRLDDRLGELAKNNAQSIYNKALNKVLTDRTPIDNSQWERRHSFLSWSIIRNAEILEDFSEYVSNVSNRRTVTENTKTFAEYYRALSEYSIKTYDKDDGNPYSIQFGLLSVLADALNGMDEEKFNAIFSSKSDMSSDTFDRMFIDSIMSSFVIGHSYTRMGVIRKISAKCQNLYEERPEIKGVIRTTFNREEYTYESIKSILEQIKADNNL